MGEKLEDSPTGQVLKSILAEIKTVKNQDDRISDIEKTLTVVVGAVESLNQNTSRLVDSLEKMESQNLEAQRKFLELQYMNQTIMGEIKTVIMQFIKVETRIEKIEDAQKNGCPSSLNARDKINLEIKHNEEKAAILTTAIGKNIDDINNLHSYKEVLKEKMAVANNRIGDLEKYQEINEKWKETLYFKFNALIVGIIGALIMTIWNMLKH